jgi:hypothetical protein
VLEWLHTLLTKYAFRGSNAGGAHCAVQTAESMRRRVDRTLHVRRAGHISSNEFDGAAQAVRMRPSRRFVHVSDDDVAARGDDHFRYRRAET